MHTSGTVNSDRRQRRRRLGLWSLGLILGLSILLPLGSYSVTWLGGGGEAQAQEASDAASDAAASANPRSNYWRAVREGVEGYSAVKGEGANILVQAGGSEWTQLRNGPVAQILPWAILAMASILLLYHLFHGQNKIADRPLSGRRVPRWSLLDRLVHWVTAISFIVLAITGLSMLIGRLLLIPLLGKEGFALWAQTSITLHNFAGPVFSVGLVLMIVMWIWYNFPTKVDVVWFKQGGGMFGDKHPSAGRMNGGEKMWFWLITTLGVAVAITGLILVAPVYGFEVPGYDLVRPLMQQANLIHAAGAILWTAVALGHIYIGTAGTEGAFEGMATGTVSEEWAIQHHDLWYEKMAEKGKIIEPGEADGHHEAATNRPAAAS